MDLDETVEEKLKVLLAIDDKPIDRKTRTHAIKLLILDLAETIQKGQPKPRTRRQPNVKPFPRAIA